MSWEDTIKKKRTKDQSIEGLLHTINRAQQEVSDAEYDGAEPYIRELIEDLESKDLNDILPPHLKDDILEFYQDYSRIMWRKKEKLLPALRRLRRYIEDYDTDE